MNVMKSGDAPDIVVGEIAVNLATMPFRAKQLAGGYIGNCDRSRKEKTPAGDHSTHVYLPSWQQGEPPHSTPPPFPYPTRAAGRPPYARVANGFSICQFLLF